MSAKKKSKTLDYNFVDTTSTSNSNENETTQDINGSISFGNNISQSNIETVKTSSDSTILSIENFAYGKSSSFFLEIKDITKLGYLSNLTLSSLEKETFSKQLSSILSYVERLTDVNTKNVLETTQVTNLENVTRDDVTTPSLSQDEAVSNTKSKQNGLFKVKAIFE